jgi:hypothetical protein
VSAGFAYVLEAEDQFHRSVWFGVMFAGLTGAWFILGSFLALIDTIAVWWTVVVLVILAAAAPATPSAGGRRTRPTGGRQNLSPRKRRGAGREPPGQPCAAGPRPWPRPAPSGPGRSVVRTAGAG